MQADGPVVRVVKSPTCGCCTEWVEHLEENGFRVEVEDTRNVGAAKARLGVPGMPAGSPGMEGPPPVPYDVIAFDESGGRSVWASH